MKYVNGENTLIASDIANLNCARMCVCIVSYTFFRKSLLFFFNQILTIYDGTRPQPKQI